MGYHLAFIGQYINAPAGDNRITNNYLCKMICYIGRKYGQGKGSDYAKGSRLIKHRINRCSTRHIKLMIRAMPNAIVRNYGVDDTYVFRFNRNTYSEIFRNIVEILEDNRDSLADIMCNEHRRVALIVPNPAETYSELLIREPLVSLRSIILNGKDENIKKEASVLKKKIDGVDKKHNYK